MAELVIELPPGLAGQPPLVLVLALLTEWRGVAVPLVDVDGVFGVFGVALQHTTGTETSESGST